MRAIIRKPCKKCGSECYSKDLDYEDANKTEAAPIWVCNCCLNQTPRRVKKGAAK